MALNRRNFLGAFGAGAAKATATATGIPQGTEAPAEIPAEVLDEAKANGRRKAQQAFQTVLDIAEKYNSEVIDALCDPASAAYRTDQPPTFHRDGMKAAYKKCTEACEAAQEAVTEYERRFSSRLNWGELIPEELQFGRLLMRNRDIQPDSAIDVSALLKPWVHYDHQAVLQRAEHFDALTQDAKRLVESAVQQGRPGYEAKELIHKVLQDASRRDGLRQSSLDSSQALEEVRALASSVHSDGDRLVRETLAQRAQAAERGAKWAEDHIKTTIKRENTSGKFGKALTAVGDKIFLQLSYDKSTAERKFAVIQELMTIQKDTHSFDEVPVVMRSDIRVEDIPLPGGGKWPDDRYVPVPTQTYEPVWGVELNGKQFDRLASFSKRYPNIIAELRLSEFSATTQATR